MPAEHNENKETNPTQDKQNASISMKGLICDTNVFIDLMQADALDPFLDLPEEVCTIDLVIAEIREPAQKKMLEEAYQAGKLTVLELTSKEIEAAFKLPTSRNLKRITDKSILLKSIAGGFCLLTGDKLLKEEAKEKGVEVHGSIWVIRRIYAAQLVSREQAIRILDQLKQNPRLPKRLIDELRDELSVN